ncbi:MAG: Lsm family RNA-binding protein, partial [candidate division WOR-3 bacterium]
MAMITGDINRIYTKELQTFIGKRVGVLTIRDEKFIGIVKAFHPDNLTLILAEAFQEVDGKKIPFHKMFIYGSQIAKIYLEQEPFDIAGLAVELEKIFRRPGDIKLYEDQGLIVILDRVRVTEAGVE